MVIVKKEEEHFEDDERLPLEEEVPPMILEDK